MQSFIVILLLSCCLTIGTCFDCKWTGCEGKFKSGISLCNYYGAGHYTGHTDSRGCDWDSEKVQCCIKAPLHAGCQWSSKCWGMNYSHAYVCRTEFGAGYSPSRILGCAGLATATFECCTN